MDDIGGLLASWPDPGAASIAVTSPTATIAAGGKTDDISRIASISKTFVALTAMVAIEEGTIALDDGAGPPGSTVRHLLAHASGLAFDEHSSVSGVGERRIYSNAGIEQFADHLTSAADMVYADYQHAAVLEPLGLKSTELRGSAAHGIFSCTNDLVEFARELLRPTLVGATSLARATSAQFPDLRGVLPGFGSFDPNPWGLGFELRGNKDPHWTSPAHSPQTFGHFGGSGTFLWVDPIRGLAAVAISGTEYGPWANIAWPLVNQTILDRYA